MVSAAAGDAQRSAATAQSSGFETVVAAGGDGTLNEVLNGCLEAGGPVKLGLLPLGTGNDFARSLGLPLDVAGALSVLRHGPVRALDVVRISGSGRRFMINVSAGGFAGLVDEKLTDDVKAAWGPLSYFRGMIEALGEMQPYAARIRLDHAPPLHLKLLNVVVANAGYVARGIPIAPAADPADGWMDLVAIRDATATRLALLAPRVLAGAHLDHEDVLHVRARHIEIESEPPMKFNADGEALGEGTITFEILPAAVSFVIPPPAP